MAIRWALSLGAPRRLLAGADAPARSPIAVAALALANKMARGIWAMLTRH